MLDSQVKEVVACAKIMQEGAKAAKEKMEFEDAVKIVLQIRSTVAWGAHTPGTLPGSDPAEPTEENTATSK